MKRKQTTLEHLQLNTLKQVKDQQIILERRLYKTKNENLIKVYKRDLKIVRNKYKFLELKRDIREHLPDIGTFFVSLLWVILFIKVIMELALK